MLIASYRVLCGFSRRSFPSSSSAGLGSPAAQGTSVPQPQPASIIEDRLLNELFGGTRTRVASYADPNENQILAGLGEEIAMQFQDWNWDPASFTNDVQTAFNLQARKQYTSNVTDLLAADATAHIAATNSVNRRSKRGGKGEAVHNGGAKTREEREIEMTAERGGVPPDWLELMRDMHTNKQTGEVQDPVARELLATLSKLKEEKEAQLQQSHQLSANDGSTASNMLSREEINQLVLENVPIKKGRRYGIVRTSEAISTSSSQLSVSSSSIVQYMERMKTELDEERSCHVPDPR
ncbi:uncharacterized protein LOC117130569 [Brassica rapa]|uniref:uncharacterized protein LOC117130569 n=1 Tax=Brassica campestris TaxID=3711 RepID=UPI00142E263C|nr:uncharacterized protein LOC117130569 [Brassica rapa]